MSVTPSKLLVGFIGFIISVCLFSDVGIAEQIVETGSLVVLEVGTRGILPCLIQRKAQQVQWTWWTRELASEHLLVYLDPYSNIRRRGGPGYKEGLFNITEDYSLVIKDVKVRDEGLYICEVSDFQTGKLFRNKTRVSVRGTGASVVLGMGARGILPCHIQGGTYEVKWKRQLSSETELLVSLDPFSNVGARDGPGYEEGLFNMTDDYSLVIKNVKVQDEGLYMCTLFDYKTGKVFRNSTRVFVQAFPEEPFPVIQECDGKDVNPGICTRTVHSTSNLTCFVKGYYPDIDLFFLHGSEKITSTENEEWRNADGTKNKTIRVQVSISDESYECVASRLPGIGGNRSVSVNVHAQVSPPTHFQGPSVAAVVVPVLMIVGMCLSIAVIIKCRVYRSTRNSFYRRVPLAYQVRAPIGSVSKLELWTLVIKAEDMDDFKKLREALSRLGHLSKTDASKLHNRNDFYESLCEWKGKTSSDLIQRENLYSACFQVGMFDITRTLQDLVWDTSYKVSKADLEHILWEIRNTRKICELLRALKLDNEAVITASEKGIREVINVAWKELLMWRLGEFRINPIVLLSLKLDGLQCKTDFFQIPMSVKKEIDEEEMMAACFKIFDKHYKYLVNAIRDHLGEDLPYDIGKFVEENNASLFNTLEMLRDWVRDDESSNYEKVNKLLKADEAPRQAHHTDAKWPPDDDLRVIASFLSPASMEQLCSKLGIESPPKESRQEERFQVLTVWRDTYASSKELNEKHSELFTALKEVERGGLLPRVKGPLVYKAELVDLAFHLFAQDLLPFIEALGISAPKLAAYRPPFQPSHMMKGTIGLVCKLFDSGERSYLLTLLKEMPYPNVSASAMLALEISFKEVCAISVNRAKSEEREKLQASSLQHGLQYAEDTFLYTIEKKRILPEAKCKLVDATQDTHDGIHLQSQKGIWDHTTTVLTSSANQVKDHNQVSAESLAFLKQFKDWRELPRLLPFDFRLALANRLRIQDYYHHMSNFLRVNLSEGIITPTFIHNILQTMHPKQREILGNLIRDASFRTMIHYFGYVVCPVKDDWFELTEAVSDYVHRWTNDWIVDMIFAKGKKGKEEEIARKHKECNDRLVDNGFLDLAREIMISEQLPLIQITNLFSMYEEPFSLKII